MANAPCIATGSCIRSAVSATTSALAWAATFALGPGLWPWRVAPDTPPSPSHGLGTLNVQAMADPVDRAVLDLRKRGVEDVGDLHPKGCVSGPSRRPGGWRLPARRRTPSWAATAAPLE